MDSALNIWITRVEKTWLEKLHSNASRHFSRTYLPSHDESHHRRVWNICKEILRELDRSMVPMEEALVEGVLIAAYFHDLGMVQSMDKEHGRLGMEMCRVFLRDLNNPQAIRQEEILHSIEMHDVKDLRIYRGLYADQAPDILSILSIADDLEALGIIGIYRYAEIYLLRKVNMEKLGDAVLKNVEVRFYNLSHFGNAISGLVERYRPEYQVIVDFYRQLILKRSSQMEVVEQISILGLERKIPPQLFYEQALQGNISTFGMDFFRTLRDAIKNERK